MVSKFLPIQDHVSLYYVSNTSSESSYLKSHPKIHSNFPLRLLNHMKQTTHSRFRYRVTPYYSNEVNLNSYRFTSNPFIVKRCPVSALAPNHVLPTLPSQIEAKEINLNRFYRTTFSQLRSFLYISLKYYRERIGLATSPCSPS